MDGNEVDATAWLRDGMQEPAPNKRHYGRFIGLMLLVVVAGFVASRFTTFCFSQWRYLKDTELFEIALLYRASGIKGMPRHPSREDARNYLLNNPNCCRVARNQQSDNSVLDQLFFTPKKWVQIFYPRPEDPVRGREDWYEAYVAVYRDGTTGGTFGTGTRKPPNM
jgi:hypothetical protein